MKPQIIAQGAEAKIILSNNFVIKDRIKKSYRIPILDEKIRRQRTKTEFKLLTKASKIIQCPIPEAEYSQQEHFRITMPFIDGKKLSEHLDKFPLAKQKQILKQIGKDIAKLHTEDIIHGDLTTSNMILVSEKNGFALTNKRASKASEPNGVGGSGKAKQAPIIFLIDFGLGYFNGKYEDKAVDIHLLKQALEAKHFKNWKELYKEFENGYKNYKEANKVLERLRAVEKRGRYKG